MWWSGVKYILMCWKNIEKKLLVFMDRCDGGLYAWVTAGVVRTVLDIISFRLLLYYYYYIVFLLFYTWFSSLPLWWMKMNVKTLSKKSMISAFGFFLKFSYRSYTLYRNVKWNWVKLKLKLKLVFIKIHNLNHTYAASIISALPCLGKCSVA